MKMNMRKQVDARIAIVVVVIVLIIVQAAWWKGLVWKPAPKGMRGGMGGGQGPSIEDPVRGLRNVSVETIAGAPDPGDADGVGRNARFDGPCGLAVDSAGNVLVADSRNHRIRLVSPTGTTSTLAGSDAGYADGDAKQAKFNTPCGVTAGPDGVIYVADSGNHRIRVIGGSRVTTLAGSDAGLADGAGPAAKFNFPVGVAAGEGHSLLVADGLNKRLRTVSAAGKVTSGMALSGVPTSVANAAGPLAAVNETGEFAAKSSIKNIGVLSSNAKIRHPLAVCRAPEGWYISDADNGALFLVRNGAAEVIAGACYSTKAVFGFNDGTGEKSSFGQITGIASDGKGHIYVCDITNNAIRKITLNSPAAR